MTVVELGAAPGGWTLVATQLVRASPDVPWLLPRSPPPKPERGFSNDAKDPASRDVQDAQNGAGTQHDTPTLRMRGFGLLKQLLAVQEDSFLVEAVNYEGWGG
jgi:hypothetical protein